MGENIDIKLLDESNQTENLATLFIQPRISSLYSKDSVEKKLFFCNITNQIKNFSKRLYQFWLSSKRKACEKTIKFSYLYAHI